MPTIKIEGPPLKDIEVKRKLVSEVTMAAVKAYNIAKETIVVVIKENSPDNVSVGGELIADRHGRERAGDGS
jgi:4-oxalocrotonate tautomerase